MEGSSVEGAVVGIMMWPCLREAAIEVEMKAQGGPIRIKGDPSSFAGDEQAVFGMPGNACGITIRGIVGVRFTTMQVNFWHMGQTTTGK